MNFDWNHLTALAYFELINLKISSFPIAVENLSYSNIILTTYQEYANRVNCDINKITANGNLGEAYVIADLPKMPNNFYIILYDKNTLPTRTKHSLMHEIGHIRCGHTNALDHDKREIEAHFFAGQMNAPNVIIKAIAERGYTISVEALAEYFHISHPSAEKKVEYFSSYAFSHVNEHDELILKQFSEYLERFFPPRSSYYMDSYYNDLEEERENW